MSIQQLSTQAQLAQASYAAHSTGMSTQDYLDALRGPNGGFTATQAQHFAAKYSVVLQYNDDASILVGNGTSLSLTVFKDTATNQLTLAIRGTLEPEDWATGNNGVVFGGAAYPQIAALYNWWLRATAAPGTLVPQYTVALTGGAELLRKDDAVATGELRGALTADPDQRLDVTGHSLGGHLAMATGSGLVFCHLAIAELKSP
jgi:Lipase (class 3)